MRTPLAGLALLILTGLLACGCCVRAPISGMRSDSFTRVETSTVKLGRATKVAVSVRMGAGELEVSGASGAASALEAVFTYATAAWRPEVTYTSNGDLGVLGVCQPECDGRPLGDVRNRWQLRLADGVPTNLSLALDVGTSVVDLRGVDVRGLEITTGLGEATIDLSGPRTADMRGSIETGVGEATIRLPMRTGVRVTGTDEGFGDIHADGFMFDGRDYINAAWDEPGPKMLIRLQRGVGDVRLVSVDH